MQIKNFYNPDNLFNTFLEIENDIKMLDSNIQNQKMKLLMKNEQEEKKER